MRPFLGRLGSFLFRTLGGVGREPVANYVVAARDADRDLAAHKVQGYQDVQNRGTALEAEHSFSPRPQLVSVATRCPASSTRHAGARQRRDCAR